LRFWEPQCSGRAQFRAAIALALPDGRYFLEEGVFRGSITNEPSDIHLAGLPYRRIFLVHEYNKRYSDLLPEEEAGIVNHRAQALDRLVATMQREIFTPKPTFE